MDNKLLVEENQIKLVTVVGTDMNVAAITGARIAMKKFQKVSVVVQMGDSVGALVEMTLKQHTLISGGSSKVLSTINPHFHKVDTADIFTKVVPSAERSLVDASSLFAADPGILVIDVLAEGLDQDGGYSFFSVDFADSTAAKLISAIYVAGDARQLPAYDVVTV